jgi:putative endonuclease
MFYVYIMASSNGVALYVGSTDDLIKRVQEHKDEAFEGHTKKYHIHKLVYYEVGDTRESVRLRERSLKRWRRSWKDELITKFNLKWECLYSTICK